MATGVVRVKPGVTFTTIAPAGFVLLAAIAHAARALCVELTITSATDGEHSGPADPHHRGEAYDVRTHGIAEDAKTLLLELVLDQAAEPDEHQPLPVPGIAWSRATRNFFGFLENPGTPNEHLHFQLRKGRTYP